MTLDELYVIHSKVVTLRKYPNRLKSFVKKEGMVSHKNSWL